MIGENMQAVNRHTGDFTPMTLHGWLKNIRVHTKRSPTCWFSFPHCFRLFTEESFSKIVTEIKINHANKENNTSNDCMLNNVCQFDRKGLGNIGCKRKSREQQGLLD